MPSILALVKRSKCVPRSDSRWAPIHPDRPSCLSRDEEIAITIVGVIGGLVTAWCVGMWLLWAWRSHQRAGRVLGLGARSATTSEMRDSMGSNSTPSPPSSQGHAYPPSAPVFARPQPAERFSLPLLSARGDLLPDPTAVAKLNRQASLPDTAQRALPLPPQQSIPSTPHYRARSGSQDHMPPTSPVSPLANEHSAFNNALAHSLKECGAIRSSTPLSAQEPDWFTPTQERPYGYQAQTYTSVPGFTPQSITRSPPASETRPLMLNVSQPESPTRSLGSRRGYAPQSPASLTSPLGSPVQSMDPFRSVIASPPASMNSRPLLSSARPTLVSESGSPKPRAPAPHVPGPFPWAASVPAGTARALAHQPQPVSPIGGPRTPTRPVVGAQPFVPSHAPESPIAGPSSAGFFTPTKQNLAPPRTQRLITPPARSASKGSPLPAPQPVAPAVQLLSQNTMTMFNTFSDSDGHTSPTSMSQEQHDIDPWRPLHPLGRAGSKPLRFEREQAVDGAMRQRLPMHSEVVSTESRRQAGVAVHKSLVRIVAGSSGGAFETSGDQRRF